MVQVIDYADDPANPGRPRYGAYYMHIEDAAATPTEPVVLRAGQEVTYSWWGDSDYSPPEYTKFRVGTEVSSCGGAAHTHIDLTASTNSSQDHFTETIRNNRVKTREQCIAQDGSTDCGDDFDMNKPGERPPGPNGGRVLALENHHYPVFWWDWIDSGCAGDPTGDRVIDILCRLELGP